MFNFDSDSFIRELEEIEGVEDSNIDYEEYEAYLFFKEYEKVSERLLRGDL